MPTIELTTPIKADIKIVFDLARSIDLHKVSTSHTKEEAIDGVTRGVINEGDFVTWRATHFGISQKLSSRITKMEIPFHFRDEQIKGAFKSIVHDHYFEEKNGVTIMRDIFRYESPFGIIGKIFNKLILTNYLTKFIQDRNEIIREYAENDKWKLVLNNTKEELPNM